MTIPKFRQEIDTLFRKRNWNKARTVLEAERRLDPSNHWLLTQIGVTYYEQRRYQSALRRFLESQKIVPDCPLTLWNLAGTLDALGNHDEAIRIYTWLMECKRTPEEDPCWESKAWTDALKTDCVYRLAASLQSSGKKQEAERCYRQYINLLLSGIDGLYSMEDAMRQIRKLHGLEKSNGVNTEFDRAIHAALQAAPNKTKKGKRIGALEFDEAKLLNRRDKTTVIT